MMRRRAAEAGLIEASVLGGVLHAEQPLLGMLVQMDVITRTGLQLQRVSHLGVDVVVLSALCRILILMIKEQKEKAMNVIWFWSTLRINSTFPNEGSFHLFSAC